MKFKEDKNARGFFKTKKNDFEFTISASYGTKFYVVARGIKKDIRLNTLWLKLEFEDFDKAVEFCENFDWTKYECLGNDAIKN